MKLKRMMAIVLCFAMVLSTMSFSVFAEEVTTVSDAAGLVAALINDQDSIEITLANDISSPINQRYLFPMVLAIHIDSKTTGNGICIRIIMTLNYDFIIF